MSERQLVLFLGRCTGKVRYLEEGRTTTALDRLARWGHVFQRVNRKE